VLAGDQIDVPIDGRFNAERTSAPPGSSLGESELYSTENDQLPNWSWADVLDIVDEPMMV